MNSLMPRTQQFSIRTSISSKRPRLSSRTCPVHLAPALMVCVVACLTTAIALGQSYYGGLRGVVRDPDGSVIANAKVTLVNQATSVERFTYSSGEGVYYFNQVIPGHTLSARKLPGSRDSSRETSSLQLSNRCLSTSRFRSAKSPKPWK